MRQIFYILLLFTFASCVDNQTSAKHNSTGKFIKDTTHEELFQVDSDDHEMLDAIQHAKNTIADFDSALLQRNKKTKYFAIKKRYETDKGGEHIWINNIKIFKGKYWGTINNDPVNTKEIKYGDTVIVDRSDITDWMYVDRNRLRGGYTLKVAVNHMSESRKASFEKENGYKVD